RDPEEDDVEAGHEGVSRVVAPELRRLVGPTERRERPKRGGEPGVEHVLVAPDAVLLRRLVGAEADQAQARVKTGDDDNLFLVIVAGLLKRVLLAFGDEDLRLRDRHLIAVERPAIPGRNLVAPPELARDAPG